MLTYSSLDSNRFGLNIFRATLEDFESASLEKEIAVNKIDILILRLPSDTKASHHRLVKLPWQVIHCDNLVYYDRVLSHEVNQISPEIDFREINSENSGELDGLISSAFEGYQNHYLSNPYLEEDKINAGYLEWAKFFVKDDSGRSWLAYKDNALAGFGTCSYDSVNKTCIGILHGINPAFTGQGIYTNIIRYSLDHFKKQGFLKMSISTQIQNYKVQKVWVREGFELNCAFDTYHINSFLSNPDRV